MFERKGVIVYAAKAAKGTTIGADAMFEAGLEAGADNVESDATSHEVTCAADDFSTVRDALEEEVRPSAGGEAAMAPAQHRPWSMATPPISLMKLIDALEDNDDVQNV